MRVAGARTFLAASATVLAGAIVLATWHYASVWTPARGAHPLQGVDVPGSHRAIDWAAVRAAGADFAYLVASSGRQRFAAEFEADWQAVEAARLRRGAVHVYSLCVPARAQADAFNTMVPRDPQALPAALDLAFDPDCAARPDRATLVGDLARFLSLVEAHTGTPMLLRIDRAVESRYRLTAALPRPIWVTGDFVRPGYTARPWRMWRASAWRRLDGVDGTINWNVVAQ